MFSKTWRKQKLVEDQPDIYNGQQSQTGNSHGLDPPMPQSSGKKHSRNFFSSFDPFSNHSAASNASASLQAQPLPPRAPASDETPVGLTTATNAESPQDNWTGIDLVGSPRPKDEKIAHFRSQSPAPERKHKPIPLKFTRSTTPDVTSLPSPSRARWENLRQHVLPIPLRTGTPQPQVPAGTAETLPARSQTPKPSRLARLGFRQVVEHAQEVDEARKIAQELERVCWSIRSAEPHKTKIDAGHSATTTSLHLAFMSSASLTSTSNASNTNNNPQASKKPEVRRPQSTQTLATYGSVSSLKPLCRILFGHATLSADGKPSLDYIPHESLVLSTLLTPFLSSEHGTRVDEERWSALEAFNVITRTWPPQSEAMGVDRYLWCLKAAFIPPSTMRTRILNTLWSLLIPAETNYAVTTSECFQTLVQGLFSLLPNLRPLSNSSAAQEEIGLLMEVISKVRGGCCGDLESAFLQEEYDAAPSATDDKNLIGEALLLESLSRCLEDCTNDTRMWLFENVLEQYWIRSPSETEFTPLVAAIHTRNLHGLSRALFKLLSVPLDQVAYLRRAQAAARLLQERLIPDMDALGDLVKSDARVHAVNVVLELICMDKAKESVRWGLSLIHRWYHESSPWKSWLDKTLQDLISKGNWPNIVIKLASLVKLLPEGIRKPLMITLLPNLNDRLVEEPPPHPCIPLTNFLDTIARLYPQVFYKPLFLCAASSKEFTVVNHLCAIVVLSKFLPDFWIRDAEMVSVALMSDGGKRADTTETGNRIWMKTRLGQAVIMVELIGCIQAARHERESTDSEPALIATAKFAQDLETRLGILLAAREQTAWIAPSQRLLFYVLFREIRLFTRSLKPASWLPRIIDWYIDTNMDDDVAEDAEVQERSGIGRIQGLYAAAQDGVRSATLRRSTVLLSKTLQKYHSTDEKASEDAAGLGAAFLRKEPLLTSLSKGSVAKTMKLLVTMSTLLTPNDYRRLAPFLWYQLQNDDDPSLTSAVCFLIMQCAEKTPTDLITIIEVDLQSSSDDTKIQAVHKIGILFNWRFQISSQPVIADRARRPFKLARGPLAFVATDIGSSSYVREDDSDELRDSLPSELRKRLVEIGWDQDNQPIDQHRAWVKIPISLLSLSQIDHLDNLGPEYPAPSSPSPLSTDPWAENKSQETTLLRRNSSSGGPLYGGKRRAVFVPSLALIFPRLASLVFDSNLAISSAARNTMADVMRNDPMLISRPVLDLFTGEQKDVQSAILTINSFLHIQAILPYPMTQLMFNNLAGFLKWATRQPEGVDALEDFAHIVPVLARLVNQVSGISTRDIRRSKIEIFLIPSGSLWFPPSAPVGPMFPRSLGMWSDPFENLPSDLVSMTAIRVSQNMLFLNMLKRNHQDVQFVRKNISRLELPSTTPFEMPVLELSDFIPFRHTRENSNPSLTGLSLMLARSHILLVAQIFRSMSRHLSDRNELAVLVEGLSRILLKHGDDIGIVSQVLIALMAASTRFRRLFTMGGGYALFMPVVLKIYTESQTNLGIKLAIEYAVNRFHALHGEAFIFQTLDTLAHLTFLPEIEIDTAGKSLYNLFFALRKGVLPSTPDAAGIHNANKLQEREALIVSTAEEKPQTFLSLLRRTDTKEDHVKIDLPEEYVSTRLGIDDFVRLFLTVIAHDPTIVRAEQFLRLLRIIAPQLYHASSSARAVLQDGIGALGHVLIRFSAKPPNESNESPSLDTLIENRLLEKSRSGSNITLMRLDYLKLATAFTTAGGQLHQSVVFRIIEMIKIMLKDVAMDINNGISSFLSDFTRASFLRESPPSYKIAASFFQQLAPLISSYATVVDFSNVISVIAELAANPSYANEPLFSRAIVAYICAPALTLCETAATAKTLLSLPSRRSIVSLIAQSVLLRGANVIAEVEKRPPSYQYLAGIVLPLIMSLKTEASIEQNGARPETWHRKAIGYAWVRLLSFAMSACRTRQPHGLSRPQDKQQPSPPTLIIALQIIKAITIRTDSEISSRIPGIWARLGNFLTDILREGSANFANNIHDMSPIPSPTHSPRSSIQLDPFSSSAVPKFTRPTHAPASRPRLIDYSLWSILELLCMYRNPLLIQMRLLVTEKLVELDHNLRHQNVHGFSDRRLSSSIFSKPRRRLSGAPLGNSPGSSPHLTPSQTFAPDTSISSLEIGRLPGYNIMSSPHETQGPKIVHLGPISAISAFGRALSTGRGGKGLDGMATTTKIKSLTLIHATYKRIRTVQNHMGYDVLLPMPPGQEINVEEEFNIMWTPKDAMDAIMNETQDLLAEFDETDNSLEDEGVLVDTPQIGVP